MCHVLFVIYTCVVCLEIHVNTFGRDLELAALGDLDGLDRAVAGLGGLRVLDLLDDFVALKDLAEDDVTSVEPTGKGKKGEKLVKG